MSKRMRIPHLIRKRRNSLTGNQLTTADRIAISSYRTTTILGIVTLVISINTYFNSRKIELLNSQKESLSFASDIPILSTDMLAATYLLKNDSSTVRIRKYFIEVSNILERQKTNPYLLENSQLYKAWTKSLIYVNLCIKIMEVDSASNSIDIPQMVNNMSINVDSIAYAYYETARKK